MKWFWLLASVICALLTTFFCYVVVYYFLHNSPTWRVVALFSVVAFWATITHQAFVNFKGSNSPGA